MYIIPILDQIDQSVNFRGNIQDELYNLNLIGCRKHIENFSSCKNYQ